jgi:ribosomal protein S18 acetylase RimI-like enzyme
VAGYGRVARFQPDPATPDAAPPGWYLLGLVVGPAWRRRGIGEALTTARMAWVAERADRVYYFTAHENRVSQELHQRLGFVPLPGTWVPPGGTPGDAHRQRFYCAPLARRGGRT